MKAQIDTNPKHFGTYRQGSGTYTQAKETRSRVIARALVRIQCIEHAPPNCCPTLQRPMQRVTDVRSSLSRIPLTTQTIEQSLAASVRSYCPGGSRQTQFGASNRNGLRVPVHTMSISVLAITVPAVLGYDIAWSTVAYLALAVVLVWAVGWGVYKLMQRNERLEQLVDQRTAHIQLQARQLARYNAELIRSNKVLQQTMDEKSKVLGVAAHDLKNSVFGIRALIEVMMEEDAKTDKEARRLSLIHNSAQKAMELINNLLSSAASSVHGDLDRQPVDVNAMTELITHSFADQAKRKDQTLTCTVAESNVLVEGDEDRLREAINNLVSNAVKYAPIGSDIRLHVTDTESEVYIAVSDEGPGLSPHEQEGLFTPFKRLSPEPTGNEGSSGLGLYIVKQIVKRHNGTVEVDSTKGEGSTFTIVLPRVEPNDSYMQADASSNGNEQKPSGEPLFSSPMAGELK